MPELPEVETVRRGLAPVMEGATITRAEIRRPDLRFPFPDRFAETLEARRITALARRAKYLLIHLDDGAVVISHLGMSGSYRIEGGDGAHMPGEFHHARARDSADARVMRDLAQSYAQLGNNGMASLMTAERYALQGRMKDAAIHAKRATGILPRGSAGWQRAQDVLSAAETASKKK